jgi:hypothetical protein
MKRKSHWTSALKYMFGPLKVKLTIKKKSVIKPKEHIASLEEVYREESLNSNHNGFNGMKEEDYY